MIAANELRHNSYYMLNGVIQKYNILSYGQWNLSCYEPVLLTPEILEKCGAIVYCFDNGNPNQYRIKDRLFVIRDGHIVDYGSSVVIKYLHQLQNLYFALCGEELNYTP